MGFLSAWEGAQRVDVSDLAGDLPGTWWVDVKKCLSHEESDEVMRRLMAATMKLGAPTAKGVAVKTSFSTDAMADHQGFIITRSIVGWNLTDSNDVILPFDVDESLDNPYEKIEHSLAQLPAPVYDRVAGVVVPANTEKSEETASFPDSVGGGDPLGLDYTPDDSEVLV